MRVLLFGWHPSCQWWRGRGVGVGGIRLNDLIVIHKVVRGCVLHVTGYLWAGWRHQRDDMGRLERWPGSTVAFIPIAKFDMGFRWVQLQTEQAVRHALWSFLITALSSNGKTPIRVAHLASGFSVGGTQIPYTYSMSELDSPFIQRVNETVM